MFLKAPELLSVGKRKTWKHGHQPGLKWHERWGSEVLQRVEPRLRGMTITFSSPRWVLVLPLAATLD